MKSEDIILDPLELSKKYNKYNRFTDKNGRLFILLERAFTVELRGKTFHPVFTTVKLLNVYSEKIEEITAQRFEEILKNELFKQVTN